MEKAKAIREALQNCERWMGGAVVVVDDDGDFEAYPGAHMTDISFTGSRDVVIEVNSLSDVTGDDRPWDELAANEQEWTIEQLI